MVNHTGTITRTGLLLAATIILQGLRLVIPVPPQVSMFVIGSLVERWVSISFTPVVSTITQQDGAYIDWTKITADADGIKSALTQYSSLGATGLNQIKTVTLQQNLNQLIPGLCAVGLTLLCCSLLKKKVSPIVIILCLFGVGIIGRFFGFM